LGWLGGQGTDTGSLTQEPGLAKEGSAPGYPLQGAIFSVC